VSGPVSARIGALDALDAQRLWSETARRAVDAAAADTTHRWRAREARRTPATNGPDRQAAATTDAAAPTSAWPADTGTQVAPPGRWSDVPPPGAIR
jgi:putative membrane protein